MLWFICFVSVLFQISNPEGTEILKGSWNLCLLLICKCTKEGQGCNEADQSRKGRGPLQPWNYFVKREEWLRAKSSAGERLWDPCCCREVEWPLMPTRLPGPNACVQFCWCLQPQDTALMNAMGPRIICFGSVLLRISRFSCSLDSTERR